MRRRVRKYVPNFDSMESRQLLSTVPAVKDVSGYVMGAAANQVPSQFTLSASLVQPNSAYLSWTPSADNATYNICMTSDNWHSYASLGNFTDTTHMVNNLPMGVTYSFVVYAYNSYGSAWSNNASVTMPSIPNTPPVTHTPGPFTITATPNGPNSINLSWTPSADNVNYNICMTSDNWASWTSLGNYTSTSFTVNNLSPNTTYSFVIYAFNSYGAAWSNNSSATTALPEIHTIHPTMDGLVSHYGVVSDSLWLNNPSWVDVHEGWIGDCWLEATMAQIGQRNPDAIKNMFTYLGKFDEDGTTVDCWNIRLYDQNGQPHEITVDNELPVDNNGNMLANWTSNGQIWVSLIEKAYVVAASQGYTKVVHPSLSYWSISGGLPVWALQAITGHTPIDNIFTKNPSVDMASVDYYYNNNYYVVFETTGPYDGHILGNHSYSLQLISNGNYVIDNPLNVADTGSYNSVFTYDRDLISKNFSDYDVCPF